jgi:hypothetical protein
MANLWVKTLDGRVIRHDRIVEVGVQKVPGKGWAVIAQMPGREPEVVLAALGRGGRAKDGAARLCNELPQAFDAARKDGQERTVTFVKDGYAKGDGQWSALAAIAPGRPIPVIPRAEPRRRRDAGTG